MCVYPSGTVIRTGASEHVTARELPFIIFRQCHLNAKRRKILKCSSFARLNGVTIWLWRICWRVGFSLLKGERTQKAEISCVVPELWLINWICLFGISRSRTNEMLGFFFKICDLICLISPNADGKKKVYFYFFSDSFDYHSHVFRVLIWCTTAFTLI